MMCFLDFFEVPGPHTGSRREARKGVRVGCENVFSTVYEVGAERKFDFFWVQTVLPVLASDMRHVGSSPSVAEWVAKLPPDPEVNGSTPPRCKPFCPFLKPLEDQYFSKERKTKSRH